MPRILLNFAVKQRSLQVWSPIWGGGLLVAGVIALGIAGYDYQQQLGLKADLQEQHDGLRDRMQHGKDNAPIPSSVAAEVEQANLAYALIQTPWEELFSALETARGNDPYGVALLAIKADSTKRELAITGEAKDFAALSAFTSALSDSRLFQNVALTKDKLSTGSAPVIVTFDLRLNWQVQGVSSH